MFSLDNDERSFDVVCYRFKRLKIVHFFHCCHMSLCKVYDVDVISYTCSIYCRIVITKNLQAFSPAYRNLGNKWHEVVWDALRVFTDQT